MAVLSSRERWLVACAPAVLLALLGGGWWVRPALRETAMLQQRLVNQPSAATRSSQAATLRREIESLKHEMDVHSASPSGRPLHFDRNAALQHVSALCDTHGIKLHGAAVEAGRVVPESLRLAAAGAEAPPPQVWRIDADASYAAMRRLLEDLATTPVMIVPLSLSMTSAEKPGRPARWMLLLWI